MEQKFTIQLPQQQAEQDNTPAVLAMNPQKFALWLFIISIVMIFASLTSAYIVRKAEGNWLQFQLPPSLWFSSAVLVLSSVAMHFSMLQARADNLRNVKLGLVLTLLLGLLFTYIQVFEAWPWLVENNVYFGGSAANPAGSFVYVLTGVHVFHLVTGFGFVIAILVQAFRYRVHRTSMNGIEMCTTYWHFLDAMWIYLFIFLLMNR